MRKSYSRGLTAEENTMASGKLNQAGREAVQLTKTSVLSREAGFFCSCDQLIQISMKEVNPIIQSRAGIIALAVLGGCYCGKAVAKTLHKNGEMSCYTYRKVKELAAVQPWFCLPLMAVPILNYNNAVNFRPPHLAYGMMVGGWMLNTTGHVLQISSKDEKLKSYFMPPSYVCWILAVFATFTTAVARGLRNECCC